MKEPSNAALWLLLVLATGFCFGFAQYFGQNGARTLWVYLAELIHG